MTNYPPALQRPGPATSTGRYLNGASQNAMAGALLHSAEGGEAGLWERLDSGVVSWPFSILKSGVVLQHYPIEAVCWHAGSRQWNECLIGIEHEGKAGEPLTAVQLFSSVMLVRWLAHECGWAPSRVAPQTLYEHREVNPSTACPSGRIPWWEYVSRETRPLSKAEFVTAFAQIYLGWPSAGGVRYERGPWRRDSEGAERHEIIVRGRP